MRSRLAVIGTFYGRHERTADLMRRVLIESRRRPDEFWVMCEGTDDARAVLEWAGEADELVLGPMRLHILPTPKDGDRYLVIPYSNKINYALDRTECDYIVYLDNGSMPHRDKYASMASALDKHPEWGAVYCGQRRTGVVTYDAHAHEPEPDAYCKLNYTQVMHRRTAARWDLDMKWADPDLADARFWRALHPDLGPFIPVAPGRLLDDHHIEAYKAVGL